MRYFAFPVLAIIGAALQLIAVCTGHPLATWEQATDPVLIALLVTVSGLQNKSGAELRAVTQRLTDAVSKRNAPE